MPYPFELGYDCGQTTRYFGLAIIMPIYSDESFKYGYITKILVDRKRFWNQTEKHRHPAGNANGVSMFTTLISKSTLFFLLFRYRKWNTNIGRAAVVAWLNNDRAAATCRAALVGSTVSIISCIAQQHYILIGKCCNLCPIFKPFYSCIFACHTCFHFFTRT